MKDYDSYGPIEFAQDQSFIDWVRSGESKESFWNGWVNDHPDKEATIREAIHLVNVLKFKSREPATNKTDQIWNKIQQKTQPAGTTTQTHILKRRNILWYAAAAIGLLLIGFFFTQKTSQGVETLLAERIQHLLPDGTMVYLNADSKLYYQEKNWPDKRTVKLTGEAFFDVKKGSTFEVQTDLGSVKVLGTSFNVRARETFHVACYTGKVEVTPKGSPSIKLLPGDLVYKKTGSKAFDSDTFAPEHRKGWRFGEIDFPAASLGEVFNEIERQYGVEIQLPEKQTSRIYSWKVTMKDLSKALNDVCESMNLKYEKVEKTYRIFE